MLSFSLNSTDIHLNHYGKCVKDLTISIHCFPIIKNDYEIALNTF